MKVAKKVMRKTLEATPDVVEIRVPTAATEVVADRKMKVMKKTPEVTQEENPEVTQEVVVVMIVEKEAVTAEVAEEAGAKNKNGNKRKDRSDLVLFFAPSLLWCD
jgi:hypothetical protein